MQATSEQNCLSHRLVRANVVSLTVAAVVVGVTRFVTNWMVAHTYGPQEHGQFALVFQLFSMLVILGELGMVEIFGVRQISIAARRGRTSLNSLINDLGGTLLLVHVCMVAALLVLAEPIGRLLSHDPAFVHLTWFLRLIAAWLVGFVTYRMTMMVANGLETMVYSAITTLMFYGAWSAWLIIALIQKRPLSDLMVGWSVLLPIAGLGCWLVMWPLLRRHDLRFRPRLSGTKNTTAMMIEALPFSLPLMGTLVLPAVMCVLLTQWSRSEHVSYFQICFSLGILAYLVAVPMSNAMLPTLTRVLGHHGEQGLESSSDVARASVQRMVRRGMGILAALATLVFAFYGAFGERVLDLVRREYGLQVMVLLLISAGVGFDVWRMLIDQLLLARGQVRVVVWIEAARYVVLVLAAYVLIGQWGARGAAMAVLLSMVINCVLKMVAAQRLMMLNLWAPWAGLVVLLVVLAGLAFTGHLAWTTLPVWLVGIFLIRLVRARDVVQFFGSRAHANDE